MVGSSFEFRRSLRADERESAQKKSIQKRKESMANQRKSFIVTTKNAGSFKNKLNITVSKKKEPNQQDDMMVVQDSYVAGQGTISDGAAKESDVFGKLEAELFDSVKDLDEVSPGPYSMVK